MWLGTLKRVTPHAAVAAAEVQAARARSAAEDAVARIEGDPTARAQALQRRV